MFDADERVPEIGTIEKESEDSRATDSWNKAKRFLRRLIEKLSTSCLNIFGAVDNIISGAFEFLHRTGYNIWPRVNFGKIWV